MYIYIEILFIIIVKYDYIVFRIFILNMSCSRCLYKICDYISFFLLLNYILNIDFDI